MISRLRPPRLSYANVVATLALFAALGGTSYAALRITGRNVANGTLTGADIKKHSVPLTRITGRIHNVRTRAGGPTVDAYTRGQADSRYLGRHATADRATSAGNADTVGGVPASGFLKPGGEVRIDQGPGYTEESANTSYLKSASIFQQSWTAKYVSDDSYSIIAGTETPAVLDGQTLKLSRADACYDSSVGGTNVNVFELRVMRRAGGSDVTQVAKAASGAPHGKNCVTISFPAPVALQPGDEVVLAASLSWTKASSGQTISMGGTSFVYTAG